MCRICFTAHITNHAPATPASVTDFMHGDAEAVTRRHAATHYRRAIRAHDHTVIRPAGRSEIERSGTHMRFQLCRSTNVRETERFRIDGAAPNENGQATSSPAVSVESGVNIDHQAFPQ